jgi:prolipoprotein diacylglyceryl transferase
MFPILFKLGPITAYSYGFFLTLAYLVATFVVWREGKRQGYQPEKLLDYSLITLLAALIGARLYFAVFHLNLFRGDLLSILAFWEGGLSIYGALFGAILATLILSRWWKWSFFQVADFAALAGLSALVVGKIGAFLAGVDLGTPTSVSWAVEFPDVLSPRHPVQLYEAAFALVLLLVMKKLYEDNLKSSKFKSGKIFLLSIFFVSLASFFFWFFRIGSTFIAGYKTEQIASFLVAFGALAAIYYLKLRDLKSDVEGLLKFVLSINGRVLRRIKFWR